MFLELDEAEVDIYVNILFRIIFYIFETEKWKQKAVIFY